MPKFKCDILSNFQTMWWRLESLCKTSLIGPRLGNDHMQISIQDLHLEKFTSFVSSLFFFQWQEKWDMGDTIHQNPDILDRVDFPFFCYSYDLLACLNGKSRPFLSRNEYLHGLQNQGKSVLYQRHWIYLTMKIIVKLGWALI